MAHLGEVPSRSIVIPFRNCLNNQGQVALIAFNAFLTDEIGLLWDKGDLQYLPTLAGAAFTCVKRGG